ncbi:hypothetical protein ACLESO_54445 [Pyxidicoccus sp. 3LG]
MTSSSSPPLSADLLRRLVVREVEAVCRRPGLSLHDARLEVSPAALDWLAARGFDPRYGARPLKRALERELVVPVAAWLAAHPQSGPVSLLVEANEQGLSLRAESVGGAAEGVGRQAIEKVLEDAATLRAEVRRWSRSTPMVALRRELALFDKASRLPAYWEERALAEESARKSTEARELEKAFRDCAQQAEAVEDLLFEAHLSRAVGQAESLARDVSQLRRTFLPLRERLYASLFGHSRGATLILVPGRNAWAHLCTLAKAYELWAVDHSVAFQRAVLQPPPLKEGEKPSRKPTMLVWSWLQKKEDLRDVKPVPVAYALQLTGSTLPLLLAGEHGVHRFVEGSQAALVRGRFEPQPLALHAMPSLEQLEKSLVKTEVRRVRPTTSDTEGGTLEDLRTGAKQRYGREGLDMKPLLEAWLQWRVFGSVEED